MSSSRIVGFATIVISFLAATVSSQQFMFQHTAPSGSPSFGQNVLGTGDFTGDGVPDYVVSDPNFFAPNEGRIYGFSGASFQLVSTIDRPTGSYGFGTLLSSAGDNNSDGLQDLLVIFAGNINVYDVMTQSVIRSLPMAIGAGLGSVLGDVDGDGFDDIAFGRINSSGTPLPSQGEVHVRRHDGTLLYSIAGPIAYHNFGYQIAALGDLDGDGAGDFAVGERHLSPFENGTVYVFSGATGAVLGAVTGGGPGSRFGIGVEATADVDGDGRRDFAVFAQAGPYLGMLNPNGTYGQVTVFSTQTFQPLAVYNCQGPSIDCGLISTMAAINILSPLAGDVDGDGFGDFGLGILGGIAGAAQFAVASGRTGLMIERPQNPTFGTAQASWCGRISSQIGDLDGDGAPDVILSGDGAVGRAFVLSTQAAGVTIFGLPTSTAVPAPVTRIGAQGRCALGSTLTINLSGVASGVGAALIFGVSNTSWGSQPLPVDLAAYGIIGHPLLVSPDVVIPTGTAPGIGTTGRASMEFTIPNAPALQGMTIFAQWYAETPGTPSIGVLSRAAQLTVL